VASPVVSAAHIEMKSVTTGEARLDRAEIATTLGALVISTSLYLRDPHPYLARGVTGDILGLIVCSIPLLSRRQRLRHEAAVCLTAIGAVHAVKPQWPLCVEDTTWWVTIGAGLTGYVILRRRILAGQHPDALDRPDTSRVVWWTGSALWWKPPDDRRPL